MQKVKAKRIKTVNWTETLRQMLVNSVLSCTIEEKDSVRPMASKLKTQEGKEYSFSKDPETKLYTITRIK